MKELPFMLIDRMAVGIVVGMTIRLTVHSVVRA